MAYLKLIKTTQIWVCPKTAYYKAICVASGGMGHAASFGEYLSVFGMGARGGSGGNPVGSACAGGGGGGGGWTLFAYGGNGGCGGGATSITNGVINGGCGGSIGNAGQHGSGFGAGYGGTPAVNGNANGSAGNYGGAMEFGIFRIDKDVTVTCVVPAANGYGNAGVICIQEVEPI